MKDATIERTRDEIRQIVRTISRTCLEGKAFERLRPYFHDEAVMVSPGMGTHARGRDVCLKTYEDACSQMRFHKLDGSDEHIDVYGRMAVACYKYDCIWEFQGRTFEDTGHEILVFVRDDKDWQVAWRTLIPGSRQVKKCPTEKERAGVQVSNDIRQTCLDLMTNTFICQLTTIDAAGFPHTSAMNNLRYAREYPSLVGLFEGQDNDFVLYLSTNMQSPKIERMRTNPKVSVYFGDSDRFVGLMLGGEIEIIMDRSLKNRIWQKGWRMYYPNGSEGPEYGVIKLVPKVIKGWCQTGPFVLTPKE